MNSIPRPSVPWLDARTAVGIPIGDSASRPEHEAVDDEVTLAELTRLMTDVKTHADARYEAMAERLGELAARVDGLDGRRDSADGEGDLRPWIDTATSDQWQELVTWVDWMQEFYNISGYDPIPPCWPAHRPVAEELAALQASWRSSVREAADAGGASDSLLFWHDRWLWPTWARLSTSFLERCRAGQHELPKAPLRTNVDFLPDSTTDSVERRALP